MEDLLKGFEEYQAASDKAYEDAKAQVEKIKRKWAESLFQIQNDSDLQLSPDGIREIRKNLRSDFSLILDHYLTHINEIPIRNEIYQDFWSFFIDTDSRIDIAIKKGQQNYRNVIHAQKIATINAYGTFLKNLGVNVGVLVLGMLSVLLGQRFL